MRGRSLSEADVRKRGRRLPLRSLSAVALTGSLCMCLLFCAVSRALRRAMGARFLYEALPLCGCPCAQHSALQLLCAVTSCLSLLPSVCSHVCAVILPLTSGAVRGLQGTGGDHPAELGLLLEPERVSGARPFNFL